MKKKFVPLFVKLDPAVNKTLVERVKTDGSNKKAVVQTALNIYFEMRRAVDQTSKQTADTTPQAA